MRKRAVAHDLGAARRRRRYFFSGRHLGDRIAGNVAERYFGKRYFRAPLIDVNRRRSPLGSLSRGNHYEKIHTFDIFAMPGFAALRPPAIQKNSTRMRFRMTGTYGLNDAASGKFPIDDA